MRPWRLSDQAFEGTDRQGQGEQLREKKIHHDADDEADHEIGNDGATPEGRGRGGEEDGGGRDEAAAAADQDDQRGEAAEDQDDGASSRDCRAPADRPETP